MSDLNAAVERPDNPFPPTARRDDDDPPARRLLAHDMEHPVWDDDGDELLPPPD